MTTSTTINKKLFADLPNPIATAWDRVLRATSSADQVRQIKALLDVYLRYTSGILLAAYVRETPKDSVEAMLPSLSSPSNGHYCGLIREILRYFREIQVDSGTPHYFCHAVDWYWEEKARKPKQTKEAKRLDQLITFRNDDSHGLIRTEQELRQEALDVLQEIQQLLYRSKWLSGYGLFRITESRRRRGGGEEGKVHTYKGKAQALPKQSMWSSILYPEVMYLSSPNGTQILEVDPFIISEVIGRKEELLLWVSTPKQRRIDLRNDNTGYEMKHKPLLGDSNIQWKEWLEERTKLEPIQSNEYPKDFLDPHFQDVGSIIDDHYKVLRHLGEGGMATVYEVYDQVMEENLALKILHLEQVDTKIKDRTKKEFKFMQSLNHPNILPVKSIDFLSDGRIAIGMPMMEGTLKDHLDDARVTEELVRGWGRDMLSALDYLHDRPQPIYHRDIKPSNVLYDSEGQVYIADFGIARQEGDIRLTRTAEQMGSLPYMAPETIRGADADKSTDRYSLAVTLHELLVGKLPRKVGHNIEGQLGEVLQRLGSSEPEERLTVSVTDFDVPIVSEASEIPVVNTGLLEQQDMARADQSRLDLMDEPILEQEERSLEGSASQLPVVEEQNDESSKVQSDALEGDGGVVSVIEPSSIQDTEEERASIQHPTSDAQSESEDDSDRMESLNNEPQNTIDKFEYSLWGPLGWMAFVGLPVSQRVLEYLWLAMIQKGGVLTYATTLFGTLTPSYPSVNILVRYPFMNGKLTFPAIYSDMSIVTTYLGSIVVVTAVLAFLNRKRIYVPLMIGIVLFGLLDWYTVLQLRDITVLHDQLPPETRSYDIYRLRDLMDKENVNTMDPIIVQSIIVGRTILYAALAWILHKKSNLGRES